MRPKEKAKRLFLVVLASHHHARIWSVVGRASGCQRCLVPRTPVTKPASPALLEPPAEFVTRPANDRLRTEYQTPLMVGDEHPAKP